MLHMVISRHTAESCPGRPGNEAVIPCLQKLDEMMVQKGIKAVGRWADPPGAEHGLNRPRRAFANLS